MATGDWVWVRIYRFAGRLVGRDTETYKGVVAWRVEWVLTPYWAERTYRNRLVEGPVMMSWVLGEDEFDPHTPTPEEEEAWLLAKLSR